MYILYESIIIVFYVLTFPGLPWPTATYIWGKPVDLSRLTKQQKEHLNSYDENDLKWIKSSMPKAYLVLFIAICITLPLILYYYGFLPTLTFGPAIYGAFAYSFSKKKIFERQYLYELKLSTLCPKCEYDTQQVNTTHCPECNFDLGPKLYPKAEG